MARRNVLHVLAGAYILAALTCGYISLWFLAIGAFGGAGLSLLMARSTPKEPTR